MLTIGYQPTATGAQATPERLRAVAPMVEELGFDALSVTDHVVVPLRVDSTYPYNATGRIPVSTTDDWFDPIALLGLWAGLTRHVKLQTSVLVLPYRNPVITAKMLASLDSLSGGRLEVGVGTGWMREEFDILRSPRFEDRGTVADDYIRVLRTLWDDPQPSFQGHHYRVEGFVVRPTPHQGRHLPILVGGTSRPAMRRAASFGDGWQPLRIGPEGVRKGIARIRGDAADAARDLPAGFQVSLRFGVRAGGDRRALEEPDRVFVGTAEELVDQMSPFVVAGATAFMLDTRTCTTPDETEATLQTVASTVMPVLRKRFGS